MRWEVPDRTEDHFPQGACSCGRDLADADDLGIARSYQQEEIPLAAAERIQHDLHEVRCACGRPHVAPRLAGVPDSALSIGPRLRALAVYLVVFQHVPVERLSSCAVGILLGMYAGIHTIAMELHLRRAR